MKKSIYLLIILIVIPFIQAENIINFYISEDGSVDSVGSFDENITFPSGIDYENGKIFGTTQELTSKNEEVWSFNFLINRSASINVYLPKYASLDNMNNIDENTEISTKKDQIIVSAYDSRISFEYVLHDKLQSSYWIYIIFLGVIIIIIFYFYTRKKPKVIVKKPIDKLKIIKDILNEREKLILNKLKYYKENNIKIKQNQLRKVLEIPKASFSRHLQELEKKNLIKRIGDGKNRFVELK
jgi:uncharacterized membrane protein